MAVATRNIAYGADVQMTVTNLVSLPDSATAGWQNARVDNTSAKAIDYQVQFTIPMANTSPAAPYTLYVFVIPWFYDGSSWSCGADGGTTTLPSGAEGNYTIGTTHNLRLGMALTYTAAGQTLAGFFNVSDSLGMSCPQGWGLVVINDTGAAIAGSGVVVQYVPITETFTS
jgi:hypothetical protein